MKIINAFHDSYIHTSSNNYTTIKNEVIQCGTRPPNYWEGQFDVGWAFELVFYAVLILGGVIGNITVIGSILLAKTYDKNGNIFIINLAITDIIVCGIYAPANLPNILYLKLYYSQTVCDVMACILLVTCGSSIINLLLIALNRYLSVIQIEMHEKYFSTKRALIMIACCWSVAISQILPVLLGWGAVRFDYKIMACALDDECSISHLATVLVLGLIIPFFITSVCYIRLYRFVRMRGRQLSRHFSSSSQFDSNRYRASQLYQREVSLFKTLASALVLFFVCWTPYVVCALLPDDLVPHQMKKLSGVLCVSNSGLNFIIYGLLNKTYRKGYRKFYEHIFRSIRSWCTYLFSCVHILCNCVRNCMK